MENLPMSIVKVNISRRDCYVGAMVKALAVEVGGYSTVKGQTGSSLVNNGFFIFSFRRRESASSFADKVRSYIPGIMATPDDPVTA
jgi:hypothetical protein